LKDWAMRCPGFEMPVRYAEYPKYPTFYHPFTSDGEPFASSFNKGALTFEDPRFLGYFGYRVLEEEPRWIKVNSFTWPVSGDLRFNLDVDLDQLNQP